MLIKKRKKSGLASKVFSFKLFILVSVLVVIFLGTNLGREFYRKYQIQKEIDSLKGDINSLEENNYKLSQLVEYCKTSEYKETQARERFNLGKEGENLVVMIEAGDSDNEIEEKADNSKELPNYKRWWNYFFATN
ncbi:MAG: septum formation initiator family protein [Patescibacteria group bacterium]|nr:septum formation initiator family protein [Patescibacteria group bacterium]